MTNTRSMIRPAIVMLALFGALARSGTGLAATPSAAAGDARPAAVSRGLPIFFEANRGQTDGQVQFMARGNGYQLFLTPDEAVLRLHRPPAEPPGGGPRTSTRAPVSSLPPAVLRMRLAGANRAPRMSGLE